MENLYYNEDVFNSYRDYVLGGFVVDKDDIIDFELIQFKIEDKIEKLILNHFQDSNLLHIENNEEYDLKDALTSIYMSFSKCQGGEDEDAARDTTTRNMVHFCFEPSTF